jgi:hypothetical protein
LIRIEFIQTGTGIAPSGRDRDNQCSTTSDGRKQNE